MNDISAEKRRRLPLFDDSQAQRTTESPSPIAGTLAPRWRLRGHLVDQTSAQWFVYDPDSGRIHLVDEEVGTSIVSAQETGDDDICAYFLALLGAGDPTSVEDVQPEVTNLTVHLTHACNLRCVYCYADGRNSDADGTAKGSYGGPVEFMSIYTLDATLARFMETAPTTAVRVHFFGGEPLLSERLFIEAISLAERHATHHGRVIRFGVTTNATRITSTIADILVEKRFDVVVSVDGDKETHDSQRPNSTGRGSYDLVMSNVSRLRQRGVSVLLRMTALRANLGTALAPAFESVVAASPAGSGFEFNIYGEDATRELTPTEEASLLDFYRRAAEAALSTLSNAGTNTPMHDVLRVIAGRQRRDYACSVGRWGFAVTPKGEVFPCHRFVGMSKYRVAEMSDGFSFTSLAQYERNAVRFRLQRRDGSVNCAACYARNSCGGGCAQIGAATTGHIDEMPRFYCANVRTRFRAAAQILVQQLIGARDQS